MAQISELVVAEKIADVVREAVAASKEGAGPLTSKVGTDGKIGEWFRVEKAYGKVETVLEPQIRSYIENFAALAAPSEEQQDPQLTLAMEIAKILLDTSSSNITHFAKLIKQRFPMLTNTRYPERPAQAMITNIFADEEFNEEGKLPLSERLQFQGEVDEEDCSPEAYVILFVLAVGSCLTGARLGLPVRLSPISGAHYSPSPGLGERLDGVGIRLDFGGDPERREANPPEAQAAEAQAADSNREVASGANVARHESELDAIRQRLEEREIMLFEMTEKLQKDMADLAIKQAAVEEAVKKGTKKAQGEKRSPTKEIAKEPGANPKGKAPKKSGKSASDAIGLDGEGSGEVSEGDPEWEDEAGSDITEDEDSKTTRTESSSATRKAAREREARAEAAWEAIEVLKALVLDPYLDPAQIANQFTLGLPAITFTGSLIQTTSVLAKMNIAKKGLEASERKTEVLCTADPEADPSKQGVLTRLTKPNMVPGSTEGIAYLFDSQGRCLKEILKRTRGTKLLVESHDAAYWGRRAEILEAAAEVWPYIGRHICGDLSPGGQKKDFFTQRFTVYVLMFYVLIQRGLLLEGGFLSAEEAERMEIVPFTEAPYRNYAMKQLDSYYAAYLQTVTSNNSGYRGKETLMIPIKICYCILAIHCFSCGGTYTNTLCFVCNTADVKALIKPEGSEKAARGGAGAAGGGKKRPDTSLFAFHRANTNVKDPGPKPDADKGEQDSAENAILRSKRDSLLEKWRQKVNAEHAAERPAVPSPPPSPARTFTEADYWAYFGGKVAQEANIPYEDMPVSASIVSKGVTWTWA